MTNFFECKIRYQKQITDPENKDCGKIKSVNETYLVDAVSYLEAEERMAEEARYLVNQGEYSITSMKKARYAEIISKPEDEFQHWYNSKIKLIIIDEQRGTEKKVAQGVLVNARNIEEANARIKEFMKTSMSDYEIASISESPIVEYIREEKEAAAAEQPAE